MVRGKAEAADDARDRALATLMAAAQDGDKAAYARLLRDCEPAIRRAARRAGVIDDRLEDVVQDTLLTLHNARQTYDPARSFTAWLSVIAQRRAVDVLRRTGRTGRREVHAPVAYESEPDAAVDGAQALETAGEVRELRAAIADLSPVQREAVERLAIREQTLAEASADTGRTTGALKVNLHRAIKTLRERLTPGGAQVGSAQVGSARAGSAKGGRAAGPAAATDRAGEDRHV